MERLTQKYFKREGKERGEALTGEQLLREITKGGCGCGLVVRCNDWRPLQEDVTLSELSVSQWTTSTSTCAGFFTLDGD